MIAYDVWTRTTPAGYGAAEALDLRFRPRSVLGLLLACIAVLVAAGAAVSVARVGLGITSLYGLAPLFDLNREASVPAFFSAIMLLAAAALLGVIAAAPGAGRSGTPAHWALLAAGFLYLSFDEAVSIHEHFNRPMRELLGRPDSHLGWLIPAGAAVAAVAVYFLPFLRALPRRHAAMFLGCGALYLAGAFGLEALAEVVAGGEGERGGAVHSAFVVVEEACEMLGVACFVYALLDYMASAVPTVRCRAERAD